jgi:hypothetical protein
MFLQIVQVPKKETPRKEFVSHLGRKGILALKENKLRTSKPLGLKSEPPLRPKDFDREIEPFWLQLH